MNPIIALLVNIIDLYSLAVIVWVVLSLLVSFNIANRSHPLVAKTNDVLSRLIEPVLTPIRRVLPNLGNIDLSPIVLILLLNFARGALVYYF